MAVEKTLVLLKPDVLERGLEMVAIDIINIYLTKGGMRPLRMKYFRMGSDIFEKFYGQHRGKAWFWKLELFYCFKNFIAIEFEGENAVSVIRKLSGHTNPPEALPGTIRYEYGSGNNDPSNAVHSSDSPERALEELLIIWPV